VIRALALTRRSLILVLTLIALVIAQSAAGLHALKHFGSRSDAAGAPAQHPTLCLECASFAPVAGAHGGSGAQPVVAFVAADGVVPEIEAASFSRRPNSSFEARAPPV
jgi:zona occludens toxin (predicted ATPase)